MGKGVMRDKLLCKSIILPSLRIHINCRLLQGMLALMLKQETEGEEGFAKNGFLSTFLCREAITHAGNWIKILCNTSLCPLKSHTFLLLKLSKYHSSYFASSSKPC